MITDAKWENRYVRKAAAYIPNHNIESRFGLTHMECAQWCESTPACKAFEYGWVWKEDANYKFQECQLSSISSSDNMKNVESMNLDLYTQVAKLDSAGDEFT